MSLTHNKNLIKINSKFLINSLRIVIHRAYVFTAWWWCWCCRRPHHARVSINTFMPLRTIVGMCFIAQLAAAITIATTTTDSSSSSSSSSSTIEIAANRNLETANETELDWEYWGPRGEQHWDKRFKTCRGKSQSPINIETDRITYLPDMQLSFINYEHRMRAMQLTDNGHTVQLEASPQTGNRYQSFVSGTALFDQTYRFLQLHFHWRNAHSAGSEHAIDGEKFSMEMHLVHQNMKYDRENDSELVLRSADAFMVIAVFFNETAEPNAALDPLTRHFSEMALALHQPTIVDEPIALKSLLPPPNLWDRFYRYSGSYTTPACREVVTWIIFPDPLPIGVRQMRQFRRLIWRKMLHQIPLSFNAAHVARAASASALAVDNNNNNNNNNDNDNNNNNDNDNNDDDDEKEEIASQDKQFIGFYRHIQELGTRRIYAPEAMRSCAAAPSPFLSIVFSSFLIVAVHFLQCIIFVTNTE